MPGVRGAYAFLLAISLLSNVILIPVGINLVLTATTVVYIGCVRSLAPKTMIDSEGKVVPRQAETMSKKDAALFPVIGSVVLFSLYGAFKWFGKDAVNKLLAVYFGSVLLCV